MFNLIFFFYLLGLPGLVQAYQTCIQSVQLYGPTNISPIINHVAHFAMQAAQTPAVTVSYNNLCSSTSKGFFFPTHVKPVNRPWLEGRAKNDLVVARWVKKELAVTD